MQNQKRASMMKLTAQLVSSMLVMTILFSCSKENPADVVTGKTELSTNQSNNGNGNSSTDVPYDNTIFVACANGGAGEWIHLTGITNFKYQMAWTDHGFMYGYHENTRQVEGVGLTSGETFSGTIIVNDNVHAVWGDDGKWSASFSDRVRMNGQSTSFFLESTYHVMEDQDGVITITLNKQVAECN